LPVNKLFVEKDDNFPDKQNDVRTLIIKTPRERLSLRDCISLRSSWSFMPHLTAGVYRMQPLVLNSRALSDIGCLPMLVSKRLGSQ